MKRIFTKALCLVCAGALALSLAACGGKADSAASSTASSSALGSASDYDYQNFNYSDGLDEKGYWEGIRALDYVTLPEDFASVAIKRSDVEPTSEEVEEQISDLLSQYSSTEHITDRAAADGDTVNINYVGSVNNVEFTGGSAENYDLTLGSGTFIDGFEDQIIGHKPGETFDVNVTFPDGYSDSTDASGNTVKLSGQKAVFTVTLNYIFYGCFILHILQHLCSSRNESIFPSGVNKRRSIPCIDCVCNIAIISIVCLCILKWQKTGF